MTTENKINNIELTLKELIRINQNFVVAVQKNNEALKEMNLIISELISVLIRENK